MTSLTKKNRKNLKNFIFQGLSDNTMVISTQVLAEYFVAATRKMGMSVSDVRKEIVLLGEAQISEISFSMILEAIDIHKDNQISFWDAIIITTARISKCSIIYTEDLNHGQIINSVKIVNPFL